MLPDHNVRKYLLQTGSGADINTYFKILENKIKNSSGNKNEYYKNIFNEDKEYILSLKDDSKNGLTALVNSLHVLHGGSNPNPNHTLQVITSVVQPNTYCALSIQQPNTCTNRFEKGIIHIKSVLDQSDTDLSVWQPAIKEFVEYLFCCVGDINFKELNVISGRLDSYILSVMDKILNNDDYLDYALQTFRIMADAESNKIIGEYLAILRKLGDAKLTNNTQEIAVLKKKKKDMQSGNKSGELYLTTLYGLLENKKRKRVNFTIIKD